MDVLKVVQQLRDLAADPQNRATIVRVSPVWVCVCVCLCPLHNGQYSYLGLVLLCV